MGAISNGRFVSGENQEPSNNRRQLSSQTPSYQWLLAASRKSDPQQTEHWHLEPLWNLASGNLTDHFNPLSCIPCMKYRCAKKNNTTSGSIAVRATAI